MSGVRSMWGLGFRVLRGVGFSDLGDSGCIGKIELLRLRRRKGALA